MDDDLIDLGLSTRLFALPKPPDDAVVVVGGEAGKERWTRLVSKRAAHALWYHLTILLYPDRASQITPRVVTAAFRDDDAPTVTAYVEVSRDEDNFIEMMGTGGTTEWVARMDERDARALWASLDKVLFPLGWDSGRYGPPQLPPS